MPNPLRDKAVEDSSGSSIQDWPQWRRSFLNLFSSEQKILIAIGRAEIMLAFIGAAVLFLPPFVFLPKLIQWAMKADAEATIEAFGKNEQVKKVFWTFFIGMAGWSWPESWTR